MADRPPPAPDPRALRERLSKLTRRGALGAAGVSAGALVGAVAAAPAEASASGLFVVVDAAGGGDYTDLHEAVATTPANHTIFVKRGLYVVEAQMEPAAGVRIVGEGYGTHIRAKDSLNTNLFLIRTDNVVFQRLRVDGNGPNQIFAAGSCIDFQPSVGGTVIDCFVHDAAGYNIVAYSGCREVVFAGNHSYNSREEGIELSGAANSFIVGNTCTGNLNGINLWSDIGECTANAVVGNVVKGSTNYGIVVQDGAHDNTILGNVCDGNAYSGILVGAGGNTVPRSSYAITISGNVCTNNGRSGIQLNRVNGCQVTRNVARANSPHGILVRVVDGCSVTGNVCTRNGSAGVRVETEPSEASRGVVVSGNVCYDNGQTNVTPAAGVSLYGAVKNVAVLHNRCFDSQATKTQASGVAVEDAPSPSPKNDNLLVGPNVLDGNRGSGVAAADPARTHSTPFRRISATVGAAQTAIPHGLPYAPRSVQVTMCSTGRVWKSAPADDTNVYLKADANNRSVELLAG